MENNPESILRSHFNHLKDEINRHVAQKKETQNSILLKEIFEYFDEKDRRGVLDEEGILLYKQLAEFLDHELTEDVVLDKLPMKKAGKKSSQHGARKTGT